MSVNDETEFAWLHEEKRLVREAIHSGKPVLGICLGAQLMASALEARVYPGPAKEIGWFPIYACEGGQNTFRFPEKTEVFHWHGETFDLPSGAMHLARSEGCLHQAFQVGPRAIGLQFHLETTPESADALISKCRHELVPARFVQSEQELRSVRADRYAGINELMNRVLTYITRRRP
jgi:GMP synthase-like glutamine amidotransferase